MSHELIKSFLSDLADLVRRRAAEAAAPPARAPVPRPIHSTGGATDPPLPVIRGIPAASHWDGQERGASPRGRSGRWHPPGTTVSLGGFEIRGGMLYVGTCMPGDEERQYMPVPSPCLVNPRLPAVAEGPDERLPYWPSYTEVFPRHRLEYLRWLADGRRDPSIPIGYVFMFFYGLERRLLVDAPATEETGLLVAEIERLKGIYTHRSFTMYAAGLLETVEARLLLDDPARLDVWKPAPWKQDNQGRSIVAMPLATKVAISAKLARGRTLDAETALRGYLATGAANPYVPGAVPAAFSDLVRTRFAEAFPEGYRPGAGKAQALRIAYRPATKGMQVLLAQRDGRRAAVLLEPTEMDWYGLARLADAAARDLHAYATKAGSPVEACLVLPPELRGGSFEKPLLELKAWLASFEEPVTGVGTVDLCRRCFGVDGTAPDPELLRQASFLLPKLGYGMEPDWALFWPPAKAPLLNAYVFHLPPSARPLPPAYMMAMLVSVVLVWVEAEPERSGERVLRFVEPFGLHRHELQRLSAFHRTRLDFGKAKSIRRYVDKVPEDARAGLAATVIAAIGRVDGDSPVGMKVAEKLSQLLGVGRTRMHGLLHEGSAAHPKELPVVVERAAPGQGFRIPAPPAGLGRAPGGPAALDPERIRRIEQETREASGILARIYEEDEPVPAAPPPGPGGRFDGLDKDHASFAAVLAGRASWPMADFERAAKDAGLMPGGALEALNEWAYGRFGEELLEYGDPVAVAVALLGGQHGVT